MIIRPLLVSLLSCAVVFGLGEIGAQWWIRSSGNALDITRGILMVDPRLGWKQRPNLDTSFLGLPLKTDERGWRVVPPSPTWEREVLVLGPSSTFGWGVKGDETYAAKLQEMLPDTRVYNAGQIGYSTEQGKRLFALPDVAVLHPDTVVVAYGVNDVDLHRFYFQSDAPDSVQFARLASSRSFALVNTLGKSSLATMVRSTAAHVRSQAPTVPTLRVPPQEFKENVREMVDIARRRGSNVILLTTMTDLPEGPLRDKPFFTKSLYERAREAFEAGDTESSREYLAQAHEQEPGRVRNDARLYNTILREIAADERVPLLDLERLFSGREYDSLFVDPIHFSVQGNRLIAEALRDIILHTSK